MTKRICPNCEAELPVDGASVRFDDGNNVICCACDKPVVAVDVKAEQKIHPKVAPSSTTVHNHHHRQNWQHQSYGAAAQPPQPAAAAKKKNGIPMTGTEESWQGDGHGFPHAPGVPGHAVY